MGVWREADLAPAGVFPKLLPRVSRAVGDTAPASSCTRAQSHALHVISIDRGWGRGCRPSAALSVNHQTGWLPLPKPPPVHLCKGPLPSATRPFSPSSFVSSKQHPANFPLTPHSEFPLFLLSASREGEAPWSRMHQTPLAWGDLAGLPATLRPSHSMSGPSAFHQLHTRFGHDGGAQNADLEAKPPRERRGAGPVPVSKPAPAQQEQPAAFPMFCTLHLSPMQDGSPAWKPADSFQSCKMKLFNPKDVGCSAHCPPASLNSNQISH